MKWFLSLPQLQLFISYEEAPKEWINKELITNNLNQESVNNGWL